MIFRGRYAFLSNMYPCKIVYKGYEFACAEAFFQASKCPVVADMFCGIDGFKAKRLGRKVPLRPDWNEKRLKVMFAVVREKFKQNPELLKKLKEIKEPIIEENTWNDRYWGVCNGKGENALGQIIEAVRDML